MVFISSLGENETVIRTFEVYLHSLSASAKIKKKKNRETLIYILICCFEFSRTFE